MAAAIVKFEVEGLLGLIVGFQILPAAFQRKVINKATRASTKRLQVNLIKNLSGKVVEPRTGRWLESVRSTPVLSRKFRRGRGLTGHGFGMPLRSEIGVDPEAKGYYPGAVEYGSPTMEAKAPIRRAVNDAQASEERTIIDEMRRGVAVQARKAFAA